MNGAEAVLRTLAGSGVSLCLANPGTSEMHMVAARAGTVSGWVRRCARSADAAADAAEAVAAAMSPPGQVATVILPADVSWSPGAEPAAAAPLRPRAPVAGEV